MRRPLAALALLLLAVAAPALAAGAGPGADWKAFAPGSFVHQRTTVAVGLPGVPDQVSEHRSTLVQVTATSLVLRAERRVAGAEWRGGEITFDLEAAAAPEAKPQALGEEKLTVDGKELTCAKWRLVTTGVKTLSWTHPEYGLVRSETEAEGGASTTQELLRLEAKVQVGTVEVNCRELKSVSKTATSTTTSTVWSSASVPGGVVRMLNVTVQGARTITSTTETLEFLVAK